MNLKEVVSIILLTVFLVFVTVGGILLSNKIHEISLTVKALDKKVIQQVDELDIIENALQKMTPEQSDEPDSENTESSEELGLSKELHLPKHISKFQAENLIYAYNIAKKDGHDKPEILQGIIWQESKAGGLKGYEVAGDEFGLRVGKRYYGIGQIKVAAARDVLRRWPNEFPNLHWKKTTDDMLIAKLVLDPKFNIRIASKYLWLMQHNERRKYKRSVNFAVTAYNRGIGGALKGNVDTWHYTVAVHKHIRSKITNFNTVNSTHLN